MDAEEAAARREKILAPMERESISWEEYREIIESAQPWDPIQNPENFDWAIIRNVPLSAFPEATLKQIKDEVDDPSERREHRERIQEIVKLLRSGNPVWPVIVDSDSGAIMDGWHRLAALHSMGVRTIDVLAV